VNRPLLLSFAIVPVVVGGAALSSQASRDDVKLERGRYLVHHVALCVECHTPRDVDGALVVDKLLQGEAVPVPSPFPKLQWAARAPNLVGLPGYSKDDTVRLLTKGVAASGHAPQAPMPRFRLTSGDAEAVFEYLMSLD
jgi:mono/diheme cytochrome c family protein